MQNAPVAVIGIPYDKNSSFLRGPALAPARIRESLFSDESTLCTESGLDLAMASDFRVMRDISIDDDKDVNTVIEASVSELLEKRHRVLALGGDHSITYPIIKAYSRFYQPLNILHLDAHADLLDVWQNNPYSHACPFARIMEQKLAVRLVQVGVRTLETEERAQTERFGVEIIDMIQWQSGSVPEFDGPLYISIDLDVLDPAFAPGVSHHEPGGLTTREVIRMIQEIRAPIVGGDIVELNPKRDLVDMTAMVAAKLLKEMAARMLTQWQS
jgi:agmatinase